MLPDSSICEIEFSACNRTNTAERANLKTSTVRNVLLARAHGPKSVRFAFYLRCYPLLGVHMHISVKWVRLGVSMFVKTSRKRRNSSLWFKISFMASRKLVDDLWMGTSIDKTGSRMCTSITSYTTLKCKHFRRHPARTSTLRRYATDLLKE